MSCATWATGTGQSRAAGRCAAPDGGAAEITPQQPSCRSPFLSCFWRVCAGPDSSPTPAPFVLLPLLYESPIITHFETLNSSPTNRSNTVKQPKLTKVFLNRPEIKISKNVKTSKRVNHKISKIILQTIDLKRTDKMVHSFLFYLKFPKPFLHFFGYRFDHQILTNNSTLLNWCPQKQCPAFMQVLRLIRDFVSVSKQFRISLWEIRLTPVFDVAVTLDTSNYCWCCCKCWYIGWTRLLLFVVLLWRALVAASTELLVFYLLLLLFFVVLRDLRIAHAQLVVARRVLKQKTTYLLTIAKKQIYIDNGIPKNAQSLPI